MQELAEALQSPDAYPHDVDPVVLVETHLSWVFLTGPYAYKVKKPVQLDFVDFSTLQLREHFCRAELECNRRFAPQLYLDVVAIVREGDRIAVCSNPPTEGQEILDWAVRMVQFDPKQQADQLLATKNVTQTHFFNYGEQLAALHTRLPRLEIDYDPAQPILDNFTTLLATASAAPYKITIEQLRSHAQRLLAKSLPRLLDRKTDGYVRECHGDLHLSNLVLIDDALTAFDCLEFDVNLRNIDCMCDVAFLTMDCAVRGREDLAYALIDGYLNTSGDYDGVTLLPLFANYRSLVRAKVAALRLAQSDTPAARQKLTSHLQWAEDQASRTTGTLYLTCGYTGSGKSYWAAQLTSALPAIRLRTDVYRKTSAGYSAQANTNSSIGGGLYSAEHSTGIYETLGGFATELLSSGENVILDAACLKRAHREQLYKAAIEAGATVKVLHFYAPTDVLLERIGARKADGSDASEGNEQVLNWQIENAELPADDEPVIALDTQDLSLEHLVTACN